MEMFKLLDLVEIKIFDLLERKGGCPPDRRKLATLVSF
jgi:hypothetical protein